MASLVKKPVIALFRNNSMLHVLPYKWVDNTYTKSDKSEYTQISGEFEDSLRYSSFTQGNSSFWVKLISIFTDTIYIMSSTEFDKMMLNVNCKNGVFKGRFGFKKQGQYFSIYPVLKAPEFKLVLGVDVRQQDWIELLKNKGLTVHES